MHGVDQASCRSHASSPSPMGADGIAYLLQVFPKYSETFILNELLEHQRQGSPVRVLSLRLPREGRFHGCLADLQQAAEYVAESFWDKPGRIVEAVRDAVSTDLLGVPRNVAQWIGRHVSARDIWQALLVRRWAKRRGIVHLHSHFGGYAATVAYLSRLMGGPTYSVTLHAFDIFRETVNRELLRRIIARSAFCVTVSKFNAAYLRDEVGADTEKVRVLYNGIPLERFPFSESPRDEGAILSVGRLIEKKGFLHLVRACATLVAQGRTIRCEIVGEGPQTDELKAEIKRLGLKDIVHLVGAWPQERVAQALSRASLFALPCVEAKDGNMDALPTVLLEAMAAGCPCVSTRLSGIPEIIVDRQTGLLVPPEDDAVLSTAITDMLDHPEMSARFSRAGRARVEEVFDVRTNVGTLSGWLAAAARQDRGTHLRAAQPNESVPKSLQASASGEVAA